jgi:hypothetical protein
VTSPQILSAILQADREREIEDALRRASLLRTVARPSALAWLRSRISRQRKAHVRGIPAYREVRP